MKPFCFVLFPFCIPNKFFNCLTDCFLRLVKTGSDVDTMAFLRTADRPLLSHWFELNLDFLDNTSPGGIAIVYYMCKALAKINSVTSVTDIEDFIVATNQS